MVAEFVGVSSGACACDVAQMTSAVSRQLGTIR